MLEKIISQILELSWVDWTITVTALIYVVLAARENPWCWVWSILSSGLWAYASYAFYNLYLDALLQLFYVAMGFVGLYHWRFGSAQSQEVPVLQWPFQKHVPWLLAGAVLSALAGYVFDVYTDAAATYVNALTTIFSILATFLLTRKVLENWLYWIVIDATAVYLFASRGAWLFSLVMILYTVIANAAYRTWKKQVVSGNISKTGI